jgi:hypothetical protein
MAAAITSAPAQAKSAGSAEKFQRYYEEAGPDYAAWSPHFNMHFGFLRRIPIRTDGLLPGERHPLLNQP